MKVVADRDLCIGAGMCVLGAPEVFDQDDNGLVELRIEGQVPPQQERTVRLAVAACPSAALRLE